MRQYQIIALFMIFLLQSCATSQDYKNIMRDLFRDILSRAITLQLNTTEKILTDFEQCSMRSANRSIGTSYISIKIEDSKITGYVKPIDKKAHRIAPNLYACLKEIEAQNYNEYLTYAHKKTNTAANKKTNITTKELTRTSKRKMSITGFEFDALLSPIRNISIGPKGKSFHLRNLKDDKAVFLKLLKTAMISSSTIKLTKKEKRITTELCKFNAIVNGEEKDCKSIIEKEYLHKFISPKKPIKKLVPSSKRDH